MPKPGRRLHARGHHRCVRNFVDASQRPSPFLGLLCSYSAGSNAFNKLHCWRPNWSGAVLAEKRVGNEPSTRAPRHARESCGTAAMQRAQRRCTEIKPRITNQTKNSVSKMEGAAVAAVAAAARRPAAVIEEHTVPPGSVDSNRCRPAVEHRRHPLPRDPRRPRHPCQPRASRQPPARRPCTAAAPPGRLAWRGEWG